MAADLKMLVVSVEYRLAPDHPFPVPMNDCYDATLHFLENAEEFGVDSQRIALAGWCIFIMKAFRCWCAPRCRPFLVSTSPYVMLRCDIMTLWHRNSIMVWHQMRTEGWTVPIILPLSLTNEVIKTTAHTLWNKYIIWPRGLSDPKRPKLQLVNVFVLCHCQYIFPLKMT